MSKMIGTAAKLVHDVVMLKKKPSDALREYRETSDKIEREISRDKLIKY
jgi:hypothetical protein